jgi:hypothetical protein
MRKTGHNALEKTHAIGKLAGEHNSDDQLARQKKPRRASQGFLTNVQSYFSGVTDAA